MKIKKKGWEWKEVRPAMALIWRESWMTRSALECGTCGWLEEFGSVHPYTSIISQSTFLSVLLHQWPGDSVLYMCERMRGLFSLWQLPPFLHHQTLRRWTFVIKPKLMNIYKKIIYTIKHLKWKYEHFRTTTTKFYLEDNFSATYGEHFFTSSTKCYVDKHFSGTHS